MYSLPRIVISPKQLPGVIIVKWLLGDVLLGEYLNSEVLYNLLDGTMSASSREVVSRIRRDLTTRVEANLSRREHMIEYRSHSRVGRDIERSSMIKQRVDDLYNHGPKEDGDEVEVLGGIQLQLVVALASHQVNGDQIVKGLKAQGVQVDVKFQESFLGGWNISDPEGARLDIESVLRMIPSERRWRSTI